MKKILTCVTVLLSVCCTTQSTAQINISTPGKTFKQIADSLEMSLNPADTAEGGSHDQFEFFTQFWRGRVAVNDSSGVNMFRQYYHALDTNIAMRLSGTSGCASGTYNGDWRVFGPDSLPGKQKI